jgi:hypothetical protein
MSRPMRKPVFTETLQIAIVGRDLEAAMRTYVDDYGIGPWGIFELITEIFSFTPVAEDQPDPTSP